MRLEPLYRMEFTYPQAWGVSLADGGSEGHRLFLAEGRCDGRLNGSMQGANHPRRRGDGTYCPDFDGVIVTEDAATVLFHCGGYGRAYPEGARQIVCWLIHLSDDPGYRWLNDRSRRARHRGGTADRACRAALSVSVTMARAVVQTASSLLDRS
jgi:hypothetical protein